MEVRFSSDIIIIFLLFTHYLNSEENKGCPSDLLGQSFQSVSQTNQVNSLLTPSLECSSSHVHIIHLELILTEKMRQ
jgi:hypothetical protein